VRRLILAIGRRLARRRLASCRLGCCHLGAALGPSEPTDHRGERRWEWTAPSAALHAVALVVHEPRRAFLAARRISQSGSLFRPLGTHVGRNVGIGRRSGVKISVTPRSQVGATRPRYLSSHGGYRR
jgi:hypothetical protein